MSLKIIVLIVVLFSIFFLKINGINEEDRIMEKAIMEKAIMDKTIIEKEIANFSNENRNITLSLKERSDERSENDSIEINNFDSNFGSKLWKYSADCTYDFFMGSCNPGKYIMPDNEVVKYFSNNLKIDEDGRLIWENCLSTICGTFGGIYISDDDQFDYPPNGDYWINPDYYLTHGLEGDCEDVAFAVASIFESKGYKTKIVGGYTYFKGKQIRDWIAEYKINGIYYRYYGGIYIYANEEVSSPIGFRIRNDMKKDGIDFTPVLMFGKDTFYEDYKENW